MVAPVQVRGSDDGVRPDELNSTHPNLTQGSCGSHLDSGERSKVTWNVVRSGLEVRIYQERLDRRLALYLQGKSVCAQSRVYIAR
ncbi:hypothetical protein Tco_0634822 [Tanacetum coccineum]